MQHATHTTCKSPHGSHSGAVAGMAIIRDAALVLLFLSTPHMFCILGQCQEQGFVLFDANLAVILQGWLEMVYGAPKDLEKQATISNYSLFP